MKTCTKIAFILLTLLFIQPSQVNLAFAHADHLSFNDSLQPLTKTVLFTDNLPAGKISLPGKTMVKIADNEIHRNMKNDLMGVQISSININQMADADLEITKDFYLSNHLVFTNNSLIGDEIITNSFYATHINLSNAKSVLHADLQINKTFFSSK